MDLEWLPKSYFMLHHHALHTSRGDMLTTGTPWENMWLFFGDILNSPTKKFNIHIIIQGQ